MSFPHQRLLAYRHAVNFHRFVTRCKGSVPRGLGDLYDQLLRASASSCLNLAEGASAFTPGTKKRFFRIALASMGECAAALELLSFQVQFPAVEAQQAQQGLSRAAALTVGLIRKL